MSHENTVIYVVRHFGPASTLPRSTWPLENKCKANQTLERSMAANHVPSGYIGIMDKKMETTILFRGNMGYI